MSGLLQAHPGPIILLWIIAVTVTQTLAPPLPCPRELPTVISSQVSLSVTMRVVERESFEVTCAVACNSTAQWKIQIPKYKIAIYFPEKKPNSSFREIPNGMTIELRNSSKCDDCRLSFRPDVINKRQLQFSTLEINNVHKDFNMSKIYCGQVTSDGKTFIEDPITLMVYKSDKHFEKQFRPSRREISNSIKRGEFKKQNRGYLETMLNELVNGNVTAQVVLYLIWAIFTTTGAIAMFIKVHDIKLKEVLRHSIMKKAELPGVTLFGEVYATTINYFEKSVHWPEAGIKLQIPQGTVPKGEKSVLRCQQAISGPFVPPPGQTFASIFYHITVSRPLEKEIELTIPHAARLRNRDECRSMQFLRALDKPVYVQGTARYFFTDPQVSKSTFRVRNKEGRIQLKNFSFWCCSTSKPKILDYMAKFVSPQEPLLPKPHVLFAASLAIPALDKFFTEMLEKEYPTEYFKSVDGRQVQFNSDSDYIELLLPGNVKEQKYGVAVKSGTVKITKKMADLPTRNEEYKKDYSPMYPPRAELEISTNEQDPPTKPLECGFLVTLNTRSSIESLSFVLSLPSVPPLQTTFTSSMDGISTFGHCSTTNSLESRPTMKDLQLIKWRDENGETREIYIIEKGSDKWTEIGDQFEIDRSVLRECEDRWQYNSARFRFVLQKWLDNGGTPSYQCTWNGLIEVLRDVRHTTLAEDIRNALMSNSKKVL